MQPDIFLGSAARLFVVLHAASAIVLIGSSTHHALVAIGALRGKPRIRLARIYAATVAGAYALTFTLGLLAYPQFRYHVRALFLDRFEPWASNLFDMKENFAALGLPFVLAAFVMSRRLDDTRSDRVHVGVYAAFVLLGAAIVWFDVFSGIVITMTKGVP
ncbi:MAG TPA: hypothetical protein VGM88_18940 [Kofleriaceae bacterium]|jgi:hypothetical protein